MPVTLSITLDLPNEEQLSPLHIEDTVVDNVVRYAMCQHLMDAMEWIVRSSKAEKEGDERYAENARRIVEDHNRWAEILKLAQIKVSIEA